MIMSFEDKYNKSLVASAVGSKSGEMFRVAMAAVSDDSSNLNEEEVSLRTEYEGASLICLDIEYHFVFM